MPETRVCNECKTEKRLKEDFKCVNEEEGWYARKCKSCWSDRRREQRHNNKESRFRSMLNVKRHESKKENIEFNLDLEWMLQKSDDGCEVTQIPFNEEYEPRHMRNPEIDRINPRGPYTKENCRLVIRGFNMMKSHMTDEELAKLSRRFLDYYEEQ